MSQQADLLISLIRDGKVTLLPLINADKICSDIETIDGAYGVDLDIWGLQERIQREDLRDRLRWDDLWGFAESGRSADDPYWDGVKNWPQRLTDDQYRIFVLWMALANATDNQSVLADALTEMVSGEADFIRAIAAYLVSGLPQRYNPSTYIISLIRSGRARIKQRVDIEIWYKNVFDIDVVKGSGLDFWGTYAGIARDNVLETTYDWLGFAEADYYPFNNMPMWDGKDKEVVPLDDERYRLLVLWKMIANITTTDNPETYVPEIFDGDIPETFPGPEPEPEPEPPLPPDYPYSQRLYDMQDPTIQSQYSTSQRIIALVRSSRIRVLPEIDIETFYQNIYDIDTANGYGLDVWGRIVGIDRYLTMADTEQWFGFAEADFGSFADYPFWNGLRNEYAQPLDDDAYRTLILWKAMANISTADAHSLNTLLQELFIGREIYVQESYDIKTISGYDYLNYPNAQIYQDTFGFAEADYEPFGQAPLWDGRYYVRISNVMELTLYVFFDLLPYERAILEQYGLLAKGAGVGFKWVEIPLPVFGFAEAGYDPFDQAPFWTGGYVPWGSEGYQYFGFKESNCQPFNQCPFYNG